MLTEIESVIVNKHNVRMFNKHKAKFMSDKYMLTCIRCGVGVYASDSMSDGGNNLLCMKCVFDLKGEH